MSDAPLLSVITPVYNGATLIGDAIASVRWQRYEPVEMIVVDDGSTDNTEAVVRSLGADIRYLRQKNSGPAAARNRGLKEAHGEIIGLLDADDQWPEGKIDLQMARLREDPDLDVVCGRIQYIPLPGATLPDLRYESNAHTLSHVHLGSGLYRRRAFDRVGLFDESLRFSEDHDWFLRLREAGARLVILKEVTLLYRLHEGNMTREKDMEDFQLARVLKKSLDRRRKAGKEGELSRWTDFDEGKQTTGAK